MRAIFHIYPLLLFVPISFVAVKLHHSGRPHAVHDSDDFDLIWYFSLPSVTFLSRFNFLDNHLLVYDQCSRPLGTLTYIDNHTIRIKFLL